jgi:hypothetical protein
MKHSSTSFLLEKDVQFEFKKKIQSNLKSFISSIEEKINEFNNLESKINLDFDEN